MSARIRSAIFFSFLLTGATASAADHRSEAIDSAPPKDELAPALQDKFAERGAKVIRGTSRTVCEFWPTKEWAVQDGFQAKEDRLYPFSPGQLIGLLHFPRRGKDFRDQTISSGWYTLRFGLQPTDGNHEGTSPTRDFLLMVPTESDTTNAPTNIEKLVEASAEAAGSAHPAMLCLQPAVKTAKNGSVRHDEDRDWWILQVTSQARVKGKSNELPLSIIVVGHADE